MKKRIWVALILSCCMAVSLGAGAQQEGSEAKTLTFWTLQKTVLDIETAQENAVKSFEAEFNCNVEVTSFPYMELRDKMLTATAGGQGPDLLLLDHIWVAQYAAAKWVIPLDDRVKESPDINMEDFFRGSWGAGTYLGKIYGVPFDVGVWALNNYNKDLFRTAGFDPEKWPETWDEFLQICAKLTKGDTYGTAAWAAGGDAVQCMTDAFTFSGGGKIISDDNRKALLNSPAGIAALDFWKACADYSPPGTISRGEEDSFKLFTAGRSAMMFYGEWGQATIDARAPDMDWGYGLLPKPEGGTSIGTFGGFNTGINAKCQYKDLAWEFAKFTAKTDVNQKITMLTPANKKAADGYLKEKLKYPDIIYQQLNTALYRPAVPNYPELAEIQRTATGKIILNEMGIKEALDEAAKEINVLLQK